jgi:hypothetical protein
MATFCKPDPNTRLRRGITSARAALLAGPDLTLASLQASEFPFFGTTLKKAIGMRPQTRQKHMSKIVWLI